MSNGPYHFTQEAMATSFEVILDTPDRDYARQAATALFEEIDRIESVISSWNAGSDIGQVNLAKPGESVRVGIETIECLEAAVWAHRVSGGLFDPTLGTGFQWLEINRSEFTVGWKTAGKGKINLGGIGKGYALDSAARLLEDWELPKAVLNGGTSTALALGKIWDLGVGGPWGEKYGLTRVSLKDQALSGSGTEVKGRHIVNPKTGKPAKRHLAAWAIHPSAAKSDALSTAFMMMEPDRIRALVEKEPEITAYVVSPDETLTKIGV